jgi:hypothetical protein
MSTLYVEKQFLSICSDVLSRTLNLKLLSDIIVTKDELKSILNKLNNSLKTNYTVNDFDNCKENLLSILTMIKRDNVVYSD